MVRHFEPKYLPVWLVRYVEAHSDEPFIFKWANTWLNDALKVKPARDLAVTRIMESTARSLGVLTGQLRKEKIHSTSFHKQAMLLLESGYRSAYHAGMRRQGAYTLEDSDRQSIRRRAASQEPFLRNLADDILTKDAISARLDLYAGTLHGAYQEGQVEGYVHANHEEPLIIWNSGLEPACALCSARSGAQFTRSTLPGFPSDGGFGGPVCEGGPSCRCSLVLMPSGFMLEEPHQTTVYPVPIPEQSRGGS